MKLPFLKPVALAAFAAVTLLAPAHGQNVTGFSDLNYWGTGTNHAGLIISWNDGKTDSTIAWGFSWNGTATAWDMLNALAADDRRLFARVDSSTQFGPGIFGIGYDTNGSGNFSVTDAQNPLGDPASPVFISGLSDMNTNPNKTESPLSSVDAAPDDIDDHYVEAWNDNGFWEFFTAAAGNSYPVTWTSSLSGAGDTNLVNNGWYALSITDPDYTSNPPEAAIAAVPEPAVIALFALGGVVLLWRLRFQNA